MTLIEIAERLQDKYNAAHYACDVEQDVECGADEYGDGNAGEHEDLRAVEIAITEAKAEALEPDTIYVRGGRAWHATKAMEVVDFDVDGMELDELCNEADCAEGEESHYHYCEG
jgi:hypothetical protein